MAREKKPVHKAQMTKGKRNTIRQLLEEYDIESAQDIQETLKGLLGGTIKEMMKAEMDDYLSYSRSERSGSDDSRNGYKTKQVNSSYGRMEIAVSQDCRSIFELQVVKKRQKVFFASIYWCVNIITTKMTKAQRPEMTIMPMFFHLKYFHKKRSTSHLVNLSSSKFLTESPVFCF